MNRTTTNTLIVADIGGTNGRFAIARSNGSEVTLEQLQVYSEDASDSVGALLQRYCDDIEGDVPEHACLATAGPNDGRTGLLTNRGWELDATVLESSLGMKNVLFVNDFKALACATPYLKETERVALNSTTDKAGPVCVMGPGTGLGVALVVPDSSSFVTCATEGGHIGFAPCTTADAELHAALATQHAHVYAELLLSGNGLVRLHRIRSQSYNDQPAAITAAQITAGALAGEEVYRATVLEFLGLVGSIAGDFALAHGATGGVLLGGGILPRIEPLIAESGLLERFCDKGRMRSYLSAIPVQLITTDHLALKGAAHLYLEH